jgi:hypothetical protein
MRQPQQTCLSSCLPGSVPSGHFRWLSWLFESRSCWRCLARSRKLPDSDLECFFQQERQSHRRHHTWGFECSRNAARAKSCSLKSYFLMDGLKYYAQTVLKRYPLPNLRILLSLHTSSPILYTHNFDFSKRPNIFRVGELCFHPHHFWRSAFDSQWGQGSSPNPFFLEGYSISL